MYVLYTQYILQYLEAPRQQLWLSRSSIKALLAKELGRGSSSRKTKGLLSLPPLPRRRPILSSHILASPTILRTRVLYFFLLAKDSFLLRRRRQRRRGLLPFPSPDLSSLAATAAAADDDVVSFLLLSFPPSPSLTGFLRSPLPPLYSFSFPPQRKSSSPDNRERRERARETESGSLAKSCYEAILSSKLFGETIVSDQLRG